MDFTWQDLIDRARVYTDDSHASEDSWLTPEQWLTLFNAEYARLYSEWVRTQLVQPAATQAPMTGSSTTFTGVLALVGVAEDLGYDVRILEPAQPFAGRDAGWKGSTEATGTAQRYTLAGAGDTVTVELRPNDANFARYLVRYIPVPAYATDPAATVAIPYLWDERLVLGVARRAGIKDSTTSRLVNDLIRDHSEQMNMQAWGQNGGHRVRVVPQRSLRSWPTDPRSWTYSRLA